MILTWAEVQQKYQDIADCTSEVIWAYWLKVMTPIMATQEDADWDLDEFMHPEETEAVASS